MSAVAFPIMVIQFACTSCGRPIEIDDEWAKHQVECPYCKASVVAPAESTWNATASAHSATGADAGPSPGGTSPPDYRQLPPQNWSPPNHGYEQQAGAYSAAGTQRQQPQPTTGGLVIGIIALVLALLAGALLIAAIISIVGPVMSEVGPNADPEAAEKYVNDALEAGEPWVMKAMAFGMGAMFLWFAGLVMGIIGAVKRGGRAMAWVAIVLCGIPLFLGLLGRLFQAAAG